MIRSQEITSKYGSSGSLESLFVRSVGVRLNRPGMPLDSKMAFGKPDRRGAYAKKLPGSALGGEHIRPRLGLSPAKSQRATECHHPSLHDLMPMVGPECPDSESFFAPIISEVIFGSPKG